MKINDRNYIKFTFLTIILSSVFLFICFNIHNLKSLFDYVILPLIIIICIIISIKIEKYKKKHPALKELNAYLYIYIVIGVFTGGIGFITFPLLLLAIKMSR